MTISEIAEGVYLHQSFHQTKEYGVVGSNGLIVIDGNTGFIVDTPWSEADTEKLVHWAQGKHLQISGSISTHSHDDRTAGIAWLNHHSIPTYATQLTNDILKKEGKEQAVNSLKGNQALLADGLVEVFYPGAGHTVDNVVVWLPKSHLLFGGCLVRSLESRSLGYTGEARIEQWPATIKQLLSRYPNPKFVVPGHGPMGDKSLLTHTISLASNAQPKP